MLPDPVRAKLIALGAEALGSLAPSDLPPALRPVARFTAAKRARLGGSAVAASIDSDPGFRRKVLDHAAGTHSALIESLGRGEVPPAADPVDIAVIAYLQRPEGWEKLMDTAVESIERAADHDRRVREAEAAVRIREQLDAARASAREARERLKSDVNRLKEENAALRQRLQQTRRQLAEARAEAESARAVAGEAVEQARAAERTAESETRRLRARLAEAEDALAAARRSGRGERDLGTARLALLLDTLAEAASGLRRELALPASSLRPAETVEAGRPPATHAGGAPAGRKAGDPGLLADLLELPQVHLVVDGYNVTKTAWPTMPLEAQRSRLVHGLAAISARTGAEVTCAFDGADVSVPPPVGGAQGVRVRFSRPGHTADELIRELVAAEPDGRAVVVVSSDREVADGVRRPGVHTVDAVALVGLLRG